MIISCPKCSTKYSVDLKKLKKGGTKLKCFSCNHIWFYNYKLEQNIKNKRNKLNKQENIINNTLDQTNEKFPIDEDLSNKTKKSWLFFFLLFFFIVFFISTIYFKEEIKLYFPYVKNIYFLTGLDNKKTEQNLIFQNIEKDINVLNDNTRVITIHGKVRNISDVNEKIPRLRASLLDSENNILSSWFFYAEKEALLPKDTSKFETSYIAKENEEFVEIKIDFF